MRKLLPLFIKSCLISIYQLEDFVTWNPYKENNLLMMTIHVVLSFSTTDWLLDNVLSQTLTIK